MVTLPEPRWKQNAGNVQRERARYRSYGRKPQLALGTGLYAIYAPSSPASERPCPGGWTISG